jgi:hypothetical protein
MRYSLVSAILLISAYAASGQGIITTIAGTAVCGYSGDLGPAVQATLCNPQGTVADSTGNVYFADANNWRIRQISPTGVITTIAGNGIRGTAGDGGPATSANIGPVTHLASDGMGHVCFGDQDARKLRCIFLSSGTIQGYGTGNFSDSGDGGPFNNASLGLPSGVEFVPRYLPPAAYVDIYIADNLDNVVRRIDGLTGLISTVAGPGVWTTLGDGGPGTSAYLNDPEGLRYWNGGLYIADAGTNRIRRLDLNTGIITTVAGMGVPAFFGDGGAATMATISSPGDITFDPIGNMYFTDRGNMRIRKVDVNGIITTYAGTGATGVGPDNVIATQSYFGGLGGVGWNPVTNTLVIGDGSNTIRQVFTTGASTTTLTVSPNPAVFGTTLTLTATVTPTTATGNVTFYNNGSTSLGTSTLTNGVATLSWTPPNVAAFQLTAAYAGDANNGASTSANVNILVQGAPTTTTIASSLNPSVQGQLVTFTSTVSPVAATGEVEFWTTGRVLGIANLVNGVATFSTGSLPGGNTPVYAGYLGQGNYASSSSAPLTQVVNVNTTTGLSVVPNPATYGSPVSIVAQVTPSSATGTVQFFSGGTTLLATIPLDSGGYAHYMSTILPVGTTSLTASYLGDAINFPSASSAVVVTITKAPTTTSLSVSPTTSNFGQAVTLSASVLPALATGTIQFFNGSTLLGSAVIANNLAQITTTTLPVGSNSITAVYGGDGNALTSTSSAVAQTVNKVASTTTLSASPAPSTWGQSVMLTATVTPASATGTVQFFNGTTSLGSATVTSGQAQLATTALPVGANSLTASYSGDANTAGSTSAAVSQTVNQASTTTSITSNLNPSTFGASVTFTATVAPSNATGVVRFYNGATLLGSANVTGGQAQFATTTLPVGTASLTATYSGDTNNAASTSAALQQIVNVAVTSTTLAMAGQNPSPYGATVTLTATVSPYGATGTVQFLNNGALIGSASMSNGQAVLTTTTLPVGVDSLTAVYSGDTNNAGSTSSAVPLTVNKAYTTATLAANPSTSTFGQAVTLTATLVPSSATGTVQFLLGNTVIGTGTVNGGQAQFTTTTLPVGTNSLAAIYSGDANDAATTANPIQQIVNKAVATVTIAANPSTSISGQTVTLTTTVTPSTATGTIQFLNGSTVLGTATVSGGQAQLTTTALPVGANSLTASYSGDANYSSATSAAIQQTVNPKTATTTTVTSSQNPSNLSASVTFSAVVSPSSATGTVQFVDGATILGTGTLTVGTTSFSTSTLAQGTHSITAVYSGDATNAASTSAVLSQSVKAFAGLTMGISPSPAVVGQTVTITANMNAAATGTVKFTDGSTVLATVPVTSGVASYSTSSLTAGSHALGVAYSGDNNYTISSTSFNETVLAASSVVLQSNANPTTVGQSIIFTAVITPSSATGTVQFLDGGALIGTAPVSSGLATFSTAAFAKGLHTVTATYSGDSANAPASSGPLTQIVRATTSISLSSSVNPSTVGQSVSFSASLTPSTATGTIQFLDGSTVLSTITVSSGSAVFATTQLAAGAHSITAFYGGDNSDTGVTSGVLTQTVNVAPPAAPSNLTATAAGTSQINLAWIASSTSGVTYDVYQSTSSGFTPSASNRIASGVGSAAFSATGLSASTSYYYRVTAVNAGGESAATNQAGATTTGTMGCHVSYSVPNQWNNGFTGAISIQNTGSTPITSWTLTWTWPGNQKVTQSWNANYTENGPNVTFTNMSYNATIAPGATLTGVGFNASYHNSNPAPTAFSVNGVLCH